VANPHRLDFNLGSTVSAVPKTEGRTYKTYVGGPDYDLKGAMQLSLLYSLGLRAEHRLLDIGCGSLRAGRFIIPYLDPGGYTGLEPNTWLIDEAIEKEIGRDVVVIKKPIFVDNGQFDVSGLGEFDFVLANSIASHTGPTMTKVLLAAVREALTPNGIAAVTFVHSGGPDNEVEGWIYPGGGGAQGAASYKRKTIDSWLRESGLKGAPIDWYHPYQRWWLIVRQEGSLPPLGFRVRARGVSLAYRASWDRRLEMRHWSLKAKRRILRTPFFRT
jgi:SAM-dependent methyltransferase